MLVENFSPGTIARLGFGYEEVRARNPKLVFASISGFGQTGPSAGRTAYDLIVQGMSGMMSITGEKDGRPTKTGPPVADIAAGMFAAFAVASALYGREQSGEGTYLDVSMLGGQVALLTYHATSYFTTGKIPTAQGNAHAIIVPYDTFPTADGFVNIAVGNDSLWQRFCTALSGRGLLARGAVAGLVGEHRGPDRGAGEQLGRGAQRTDLRYRTSLCRSAVGACWYAATDDAQQGG